MVLNYIWIAFFLIAFIVALVKLIFFADFTVFPAIMQSTFDTSKQGFEISLGLTGVLSLWLGVVNALARLLGPVFARLFPDVPKGHPVVGNIFMNLAANMLGLDNAATPLGLKAMEGLQELNAQKDTASNPMIMFLVLNTSGLTLIPVSIMTYRFQCGAAQPTDIFVPILLATFVSTLAGIIITSLYQRINLFNRTLFLTLGGMSIFMTSIVWIFSRMDAATMNIAGSTTANVLLLLIIILFILAGIRKKINVYDAFIEGAKEGFSTAVRIIPYLIAVLVGIGVFRASGAMDWLIDGLHQLVAWRATDGADETAERERCTRDDGRRDEHLRRRFLCGPLELRVSRLYRHHLLHPCGLLRQRRCAPYAPRRGLRSAGRLGRRHCRHRYLLFILCYELGAQVLPLSRPNKLLQATALYKP